MIKVPASIVEKISMFFTLLELIFIEIIKGPLATWERDQDYNRF